MNARINTIEVAPAKAINALTQNYATLGPKLLAQGFEPIPVNGKRPAVKGWEKVELTEAQVEYWAANGKGNLNVGIRTGYLAPVDIDIYNAEVSALVAEKFQERFGKAPMRIGEAPKRLLLYRAEAPGPKITSSIYICRDKLEHRVEVLGVGQQFVAYGIHPDTLRPYQWPNESLLDLELWELPVINRDEVAAWIRKSLLPLLSPHGFRLKMDSPAPSHPGTGAPATDVTPYTPPTYDDDDPFDSIKLPHDDVDVADLKWMLDHLAESYCDDRDAWRDVIFAVHHQFIGSEQSEEALELLEVWSSKSSKYHRGDVEGLWNNASEQRHGLLTIGSVKNWLGDAWKDYRAQRKVEKSQAEATAQGWESRIEQAPDAATLEKLAADICATPGLSEGTIATLAGKAGARCKVLNITMTAARWKKKMTPKLKASRPAEVDLADFIPYGLPEPGLNPETFPQTEPTENGTKVKNTIANVRRLLEAYGITAYYDGIKKKPIINIPGARVCSDQADNAALSRIESLGNLNGMTGTEVAKFAAAVAYEHERNPVADWIKSKSWDGQDRVAQMCDTLTVRSDYPPELRNLIVRRWLISAAAAAMKPAGFQSKGVLTLQGSQNIGKTAWVANLLPPGILSDYVLLGAHLDPSNRDSVKTAISHWIVELGEVDSTMKKSDVAMLKAFISQRTDKLRLPYNRVDSEFQRRTVFAASVNLQEFLRDETGNVRWWTVPVTAINFQHGIDLQQMWAQVAAAYDAGEQWWLTNEETAHLEAYNKHHTVKSSIHDMLMDAFDFEIPEIARRRMTATQVLQQVLEIKVPTNAQAREAGTALRALLGEPTKSKGLPRWKVPVKFESAIFDD